MPVVRGDGVGAFALAAVVEELLPEISAGHFSFGVGHQSPLLDDTLFGLSAEGTCGLVQRAGYDPNRYAEARRFGRRVDRHDDKLEPVIREGSRLALRLSPHDDEGRRTARFFVDESAAAVFVDIEDDGGDSDWVAGVTLSRGARVRLVPPQGAELCD